MPFIAINIALQKLMKSRFNLTKILIQGSLASLGFIGLLLLSLYLHNFFAVIPDQVYRSRELTKKQFAEVVKEYHIRSIINLRGAHPGIKWYDDEMEAVKEAHINHYDYALQSKNLPAPATLVSLTRTLDTAPKPLLIHCESGVDRTGLAAVIALLLQKDQPLSEVEKQVSYRYFVFSQQSVGKQLLQRYEHWLQQAGVRSNREAFLHWLAMLN